MTRRIEHALAAFQLRKAERDSLSASLDPDHLYSTFTPIPVVLTIGLWTAVYVLLQRGDQVAMRFLMRWVSLFRLDEIFDVPLFEPHVVYRIYRVFVVALVVLASLKALTTFFRLVFSFAVIAHDRLVLVESYLVSRRVDEFPLARIARLTTRDTLLHRLVGIGTLEVATSDHATDRHTTNGRRFGPVGRFGRFSATLTDAVGTACGSLG